MKRLQKIIKPINKTKILLKIKRFFVEQIWIHAIIICSILLCAWIFNRWIQAMTLLVSHYCIRQAFEKQYHKAKTALCIIFTLSIFWFAIPVTLPLSAGLLSSIPIAFLICFFGYLAQDRVDLQQKVKNLNNYVLEIMKKIEHKDIYAMNEDELYEHCRNCGLDEEDCKIAYFVIIERLHDKELYNALPYSEATIKRKRLKIMAKINSQPKNVTNIDIK